MKIKKMWPCLAVVCLILGQYGLGCNKNPTAPVPPTVAFSSAKQTVNKNSGIVKVDVALSAAGKSNVIIPFTVMSGSTANNPLDYTLGSTSVVIPIGDSTGSINLSLFDNGPYQQSKTVILQLGTPTNATLGTRVIDTVIILDTTTVALSSVRKIVAENSGTVSVEVVLSAASKSNVTIPVIVSDNSGAKNPLFYTPDSTAIVIPAGSLTGSVSLSLIDSVINESSKTVLLRLGTPINATLGADIVDTTVIVNKNGFGQLYKLSDNELPGWVQDTSSNAFSVWKGEDMFNRIDGGADLYLKRGCLMSMFQNEIGPNGPDSQVCLVMAMDFGTDALADSMFEFQKQQASVPIPQYETSVAIGYATLGGLTAYAHFKAMYFELQQGGYADQDSACLAATRFFKALELKTK